MGAHGTCEDALRNVAAFHSATVEDQRKKERAGKKRKEKDKKKKSKADKQGKRKKEGKHKKSMKQESASEDGSSSQGGSDEETLEQQLARGRAAVRLTREVMARYPQLKQDLREVLRTLDAGKGVDVAGLPDPELRALLSDLLSNLGLHKSSKGLHIKKPGAPAVLPQLCFVLDETPAAPSKPSVPAPRPAPDAPARSANGHETPRPSDPDLDAEPASGEKISVRQPPGPYGGGKRCGNEPTSRGDDALAPQKEGGEGGERTGVIGPQMGPPSAEDLPDMVEDAENSEEEVDDVIGGGPSPQGPPGRRVVGPAMPPPEVLAAAAQAPFPEDEFDGEEDDEVDLIGPLPPAVIAEVEAAGDDVRSHEVARVLRVLDPGQAEDPSKPRDAYELLGVPVGATAGEIKKRYMRLSLLIHPDKCGHPRAHDAFQAVSSAAKQLQDTEKRAAVDTAREEARMGKIARELEEQEERERQWRVVRGMATADDLKGPARRGPQSRDTWMTDLPTERRAPAQMSQTSVTSFSRLGVRERGDTRDWTETPAQRQLRLESGSTGGPALLGPAEASAARNAAQAAAAVDAFNRTHRQKSLVEQHQEKLKAKEKKEKKKRKADGPAGDKAEWEGQHPWRPFDREKDLLAGPARPSTREELLKKSGDLSGRFASGAAGQRSFL